jgi:hypothetical protein
MFTARPAAVSQKRPHQARSRHGGERTAAPGCDDGESDAGAESTSWTGLLAPAGTPARRQRLTDLRKRRRH